MADEGIKPALLGESLPSIAVLVGVGIKNRRNHTLN
jgi:hypothetical protein